MRCRVKSWMLKAFCDDVLMFSLWFFRIFIAYYFTFSFNAGILQIIQILLFIQHLFYHMHFNNSDITRPEYSSRAAFRGVARRARACQCFINKQSCAFIRLEEGIWIFIFWAFQFWYGFDCKTSWAFYHLRGGGEWCISTTVQFLPSTTIAFRRWHINVFCWSPWVITNHWFLQVSMVHIRIFSGFASESMMCCRFKVQDIRHVMRDLVAN